MPARDVGPGSPLTRAVLSARDETVHAATTSKSETDAARHRGGVGDAMTEDPRAVVREDCGYGAGPRTAADAREAVDDREPLLPAARAGGEHRDAGAVLVERALDHGRVAGEHGRDHERARRDGRGSPNRLGKRPV